VSLFGDPDVLPWRDDRPWTDRPGDQAGCPPGYACQFVAPGSDSALPYPGGNGSTWVRCRLIATTTPATTPVESGTSWAEWFGIGTGAVRDTAADVAGAAPTLGWLGLGGVGLALVVGLGIVLVGGVGFGGARR
jgi:hypothetical protein